jgi:protein-S-isoprenylcysteine O-methyltransferase Ste14
VDERTFFDWLLVAWLCVAAVTFAALFFVSAPYGRHGRAGWGPTIPFLPGWVLMELPSPVGMIVWFAVGDRQASPVAMAFLALWLLHYANRTFVYAWARRDRGNPMPLSVVALGFVFNLFNAYINGRWLFALSDPYPVEWLTDPRFLVGAAVFLAAWAANVHADAILFRLRRPGETGYAIPRGGLYRWISCPNYFAECVEWLGWALLTWSLPGLVFALWTAANLAPRALTHHRWYQEKFPDYPVERKALVPFVV